MAKYRVYMETVVSTSTEVEAADETEALEKALTETTPPSICHQCAGYGDRDRSQDIGDHWEPAVSPDEDETKCVEKIGD